MFIIRGPSFRMDTNANITRTISNTTFGFEKNWFEKYEFGAILLGRMTPSIRPFAPFFVGSFKLDYKKFLFFDLLACAIWGLGLVLLVVLWEYIANLF